MFRLTSARLSSAVAVVLTLVVAPLGLVAAPAEADTAPAAGLPATVAADALPTAQIDGVAWDQLIVGDTVYVGGSFTTARPAGSAAGTNTVPRANMLAYKLSTGQLISTFAPTFDAQIKSLAASPDGSRIYAAGNFTKVNGVTRNRVVALDPSTGAVITSFNPSSNGVVNDVVASASTVYLGGPFTAMNGVTRNRLAAVSSATGALQSWAPNADAAVQSLVLSPDRTKVVVGGAFTTLNGSGNPGYGLGMVDATSGASLPMSVNSEIRNAGANSAILSLKEDADGFYGSGYHFGGGGNLEGSFQADWDGNLKWVEDCHGDTYDIAPIGNVVYSASPHALLRQHRPGGFPQTSPSWTFQRGDRVRPSSPPAVQAGHLRLPRPPRPAQPDAAELLPRHQHRHLHGQVAGGLDGRAGTATTSSTAASSPRSTAPPSRAWCGWRPRPSRPTSRVRGSPGRRSTRR